MGTRLMEKDLPMPNAIFHELATWATINFAYTHKTERAVAELASDASEPEKVGRLLKVIRQRLGHRLAFAVEEAKIGLSDANSASLSLAFVEKDLAALVQRGDFERAIQAKTDRLYRRPASASPPRAWTRARSIPSS